jgi:hypothetical protein
MVNSNLLSKVRLCSRGLVVENFENLHAGILGQFLETLSISSAGVTLMLQLFQSMSLPSGQLH